MGTQKKKESVEEGGVINCKRVMGWKRRAVTSYCRLRGGKGIEKW